MVARGPQPRAAGDRTRGGKAVGQRCQSGDKPITPIAEGGGAQHSLTCHVQRLQLGQLAQCRCQRLCSLSAKLVPCITGPRQAAHKASITDGTQTKLPVQEQQHCSSSTSCSTTSTQAGRCMGSIIHLPRSASAVASAWPIRAPRPLHRWGEACCLVAGDSGEPMVYSGQL